MSGGCGNLMFVFQSFVFARPSASFLLTCAGFGIVYVPVQTPLLAENDDGSVLGGNVVEDKCECKFESVFNTRATSTTPATKTCSEWPLPRIQSAKSGVKYIAFNSFICCYYSCDRTPETVNSG